MKEFLFQTEESKKVVLEWWESLQNNTGARADLRRCSEASHTIYIPQTHVLISSLEKQSKSELWKDRIGAICGLLAHVKEHNGQYKIAQQMAKPNGSDKAVLSDLRFRRIIQCATIEELYPYLIRVIRLLDGKINIHSLAESVYYWSERTKKNWAYDYYGTSFNTSENNQENQQIQLQGTKS